MGYRIPKVKYGIGWRLSFETRKNGNRTEHSIPKSEWASLGIFESMTREQAHERVNVLNSQIELKDLQLKRQKIGERLYVEKLKETALLSGSADFEKQLGDKQQSHWRACRKLLCELAIEPSDWADNKKLFYRYFERKRWSASHIQKICYIMNLWGRRLSKQQKQFFEPLQTPRYSERDRIDRAYFEKRKKGLASGPLLPNELERKRDQLKPSQYNWLYLSVWFGLRPKELDELKYRVEETSKGKILWIYQSKLVRVPHHQREKPIPCVRPEQLLALGLLENRKRPLTKTVKRLFGERVTLYGGRKGFTDLMLSFGYRLEDISVWLGHRSIERTWRSYMNKQRVVFPD